MIDCQVLTASSFKSPKNGVTYYTADLFIPSLNIVLPLMSVKSISSGAKGKVVLGYTNDRRALRATDFVLSA